MQGGKAKAIVPSKNLLLLAASPKPAEASAPAAPAAASKQVALPAEPKAVVKLLLKTFNKKQLSEIAKLLVQGPESILKLGVVAVEDRVTAIFVRADNFVVGAGSLS